MFLSAAIKPFETETQRRLYSLFTRAVKNGEVPALKLLDKMTITGRNGEAREVQDFHIPESQTVVLDDWIERNKHKPITGRQGMTGQQVQKMPEEEVLELIQKQNAPKKKRQPRKAKTDK